MGESHSLAKLQVNLLHSSEDFTEYGPLISGPRWMGHWGSLAITRESASFPVVQDNADKPSKRSADAGARTAPVFLSLGSVLKP